MKCRSCSKEVNTVFVDLGFSPPSNSYIEKEKLDEFEVYYPLKVFVCNSCFLVQVDEYKKANEIFDNNYAYFSSISNSWLKHSSDYVDKMISDYGINADSYVIEIASNDGYLLQYFKKHNVSVLGIEPTESTAKISRDKGIDTITEFFGTSLANKLAKNQKPDLILGNNVLAHVPDINDFINGVSILLSENGFATFEFPHLLQLMKLNQFDTIYHEHFSYLSLISLEFILDRFNMEIFNVDKLTTHGGSLRIYIKHKNSKIYEIKEIVLKIKKEEIIFGLTNIESYQGFQNQVLQIKLEFYNFINNAIKEKKKVASYGAAAKGSTFLNYCGAKTDMINFVIDRADSKINKFMPGSHIPILNENTLLVEKPDYIIIFPWNIKNEVVKQLEYTREWGAKFVTFIPYLIID